MVERSRCSSVYGDSGRWKDAGMDLDLDLDFDAVWLDP